MRLRLVSDQLSLAVHRAFRQRGNLILEQLLRLLPDAHVLPVLQTEQTGQQRSAESLGRLARQQAGQVVDADDAQRQAVAALGQWHGNRRAGEGGVDVVDGNRVVGVGGVARDVADDTEAARGGRERLCVNERRDLGGQVDAVDEDVGLDDLLVRAGLGRGFGEVPFLEGWVALVRKKVLMLQMQCKAYDDVFQAGADAEVHGATAAAAESTDDQDARVVAGLGLAFLDGLLDVVDEEVLILVARDAGQRLILAVLELPCPSQEGECGASKAGVLGVILV